MLGLRYNLCRIPAAFGLNKPSHGEDDGRISFRAIALLSSARCRPLDTLVRFCSIAPGSRGEDVP